jgi:hypothetical protein
LTGGARSFYIPGAQMVNYFFHQPFEAIAKPFVIPECLYREYGFSSS